MACRVYSSVVLGMGKLSAVAMTLPVSIAEGVEEGEGEGEGVAPGGRGAEGVVEGVGVTEPLGRLLMLAEG